MYGHTAYHMSTNYQILYSTFKWLLEAFFLFFSNLLWLWCGVQTGKELVTKVIKHMQWRRDYNIIFPDVVDWKYKVAEKEIQAQAQVPESGTWVNVLNLHSITDYDYSSGCTDNRFDMEFLHLTSFMLAIKSNSPVEGIAASHNITTL